MKNKVKTAFVSGSTSGLGYSIAQCLASSGMFVIIHGRNDDKLNGTIEHMKKQGMNVAGLSGDISVPGVAEEISHRVLEKTGSELDILINNVGGGGQHHSWWDTPSSKWRAVYELNVVSAVEFARILVPNMIKRKYGRVIFVSSTAAIRPLDIGAEYSAAKMAVRTAAESLAIACKGTGVTVNTVSPGLLSASTHSVNAELKQNEGLSFNYPTLIDRLPSHQDVTAAIDYLVSDNASGLTATNIEIDGGFRLITSITEGKNDD